MPGTVFPTTCPRPTTSGGERVLHARLSEQLPEGWFAWHSLALNLGASEWIGEADFVVACSTRGLLVLEVKSGHVVRRGGIWLQNGKPMKRSPHDQARDFSYRLSKQIEAAGGGKVPFASACVFTNMKGVDKESTDEASGAVLHELDLHNLGPALVGLFDRLVPARKPPMFALWKKALQGLWGDRWVPKLDVPTQVKEAENADSQNDAPVRLTIGRRRLMKEARHTPPTTTAPSSQVPLSPGPSE